MKRALVITLVIAFFMQACALAIAAPKVTITLGNLSGDAAYTDWLERQIQRFMDRNPDIQVDFVKVGGAAKLATLVAGGVAPDITDGFTSLIASLQRQNVFLNLNSLIAADPQLNARNFIPSSVEDFMQQGVQWGVPGQAQPWITFYNEDLFQLAGLQVPSTMGARWTWQNAIAIGKKLTYDENGDGTKDVYGIQVPSDLLHTVVWVRQAGGSYFDKIVGGTKPTFTTPQVTQAWQFLQGLFTEHGISSPSASLWMKGKIGFNWSDANYHIGPLQRNAKFAWDIARLPKGPVNDTTAVGGSGFQIINGSKHVAESFALIKFMVTDKESAQDFMKSTGRVSAWLPNAREYARLMSGIVDNVELSLEYMLESYVKPRDVNPYYDEVRKSFDPIAAQMVKGEISVAQAQEQAQHAAEVVMGLK